ncbi:MAG: DUF192 domain-containing protein [Actinobacteria bacterium]|nr:DUF192 domain-containing protein [Actinomycetota bacterium]
MWARRLSELPTHDLVGGGVVIEAATPWSRLLGLAGLELVVVPPRHALLLRPCRSVHTFGMRFDLDLIFLDAHGRVVAVERAVPPGRIRTCRAAAAVLELPHRPGRRSFRFERCGYGQLFRGPIQRAARA